MKTIKKIGNQKVVRGCREITNYSFLEGISDTLKVFKIYRITHQLKQAIYQGYLKNEIDSTEYQTLRKKYNINESELSASNLKCHTYILAALINGNKQKIIICDNNNNHDFSDDPILLYNVDILNNKFPLDSCKTSTIQFEYFLNKKVHEKQINIKVLPINPSFLHSEPIDTLLYLSYVICEHKIGSFAYKNNQYELQIPHNWGFAVDYENTIVLLADKNNYKTIYRKIEPEITIGREFNLDGNIYLKVNSISMFGDSLNLSIYPVNNNHEGIYPGDFIKPLDFYGVFKENVKIPSTDKYTLLDFWGTWCGPCIAGLPNLKEFYQKYKDRIELVSIAHDKDIEKVKKFIEEKEMNWVHKFENNAEKKPEKLVEKLKVECFPTFILLDKSGKIISRGCGEQQLKEIEKILN
jgi:thiol-disulfide isomerase/thioredoxin